MIENVAMFLNKLLSAYETFPLPSLCLLMQVKGGERATLIGLLLLVIPFVPASNVFIRVGFVVAERILYIPRYILLSLSLITWYTYIRTYIYMYLCIYVYSWDMWFIVAVVHRLIFLGMVDGSGC